MSSSVQNESKKFSSWCGDLYEYEGFWNHKNRVEKIMAAQENFEAKPTDIFLASYVKTGTTWLKALAFAIATRSSFSTSPLLTKVPHDCIPNLEKELTTKSTANRANENPLVATHISYTSLPKSIRESGCKIVYIWRDVKDVFVSFWFFFNKIRDSINAIPEPPPPIEEAFEQFCQGVLLYGPYWDHVLGYWKAKLELPDKILFLKYEEMKKDTGFYVKQLAEFMGYPFSSEEEENGVVEKIISMCSFDSLSNLEVNKTGKYHPADSFIVLNNNIFFRKGEIGDWKNVLTPQMGARLDSIMDNKLNGSGLLKSSSQNETKNVLTPEMEDHLDFVMDYKLNASSLPKSSSQNKIESKNMLTPEMEARLDSVMDSKVNTSRLFESSSKNNVLTPEMEARLDSVMGNL